MVNKKTIWLDLRFLEKDNYYSQFIYELVLFLVKRNSELFYNIYINPNFKNLVFGENTKIITSKTIPWSISEHFFPSKKMKNEEESFIIFFNNKIPVNIKKDYVIFIPELTSLHFPKKENFIKKLFNNYLFLYSCKNAKKIICFNKITKEEINDKLNIFENKINIVRPFFSRYENKDNNIIKINLKTKYNISDNFVIYDSWIWIEKNLDRLLEVFINLQKNNINISLLILDNDTIKNITFRKQIIQNWLTNKIFFIWEINKSEQDFFYKETLWVIFPSLYSVFPFHITKALNYNSNILSSNLNSIKNIIWNQITYFNPNNISDIYKKIIWLKKQNNDYSNIFEENNINNTYKDLKNIIESV